MDANYQRLTSLLKFKIQTKEISKEIARFLLAPLPSSLEWQETGRGGPVRHRGSGGSSNDGDVRGRVGARE